MQTSGDLVGPMIEFPAGMEGSKRHLHSGFFLCLVHIHRYAAAIVIDGDGVVVMDHKDDLGAKSCHGFIHRVVHHFVNQMMKPAYTGITNVHGRPTPNRLGTFQDLDGGGVVTLLGQRFG